MDVTNWHGLCLLEDMLSKGLQPCVVTFANVAGAHRQALSDELEGMADKGVIPNKVFIETFLGALFPARLTAAWTVDDVGIRRKGTSRDRLRVVKSVLKDAEVSRCPADTAQLLD